MRNTHKDGCDIARLKRARQAELKKLATERRAAVRAAPTKEEKAVIRKEFAARKKDIKKQYDSAIGNLSGMRSSRRRNMNRTPRTNNKTKRRRVTHTTATLDHTLHAVSIVIVMTALHCNMLSVPEDLTHMSDCWGRHGKFGKSLRRRLYGSAMLKFQQYIRHKAAWYGVETLDIQPRNTSVLYILNPPPNKHNVGSQLRQNGDSMKMIGAAL